MGFKQKKRARRKSLRSEPSHKCSLLKQAVRESCAASFFCTGLSHALLIGLPSFSLIYVALADYVVALARGYFLTLHTPNTFLKQADRAACAASFPFACRRSAVAGDVAAVAQIVLVEQFVSDVVVGHLRRPMHTIVHTQVLLYF